MPPEAVQLIALEWMRTAALALVGPPCHLRLQHAGMLAAGTRCRHWPGSLAALTFLARLHGLPSQISALASYSRG